jgi:hypothetical protein
MLRTSLFSSRIFSVCDMRQTVAMSVTQTVDKKTTGVSKVTSLSRKLRRLNDYHP